MLRPHRDVLTAQQAGRPADGPARYLDTPAAAPSTRRWTHRRARPSPNTWATAAQRSSTRTWADPTPAPSRLHPQPTRTPTPATPNPKEMNDVRG